ncbi:venom allergen 3-like [Belonocnema kinseyi]|uniref:venom allergen 3-like n=1 Tax=Belonocnema kinseyi TaxID=2817044 RepID=UPI00143D3974|nr:venom allergen 3-like [Belonocnema kinseyi]
MVRVYITFVVLILAVLKFSDATDYCNIGTCAPGVHTMCLFQNPAPQCQAYCVGLTDQEKQLILSKHNELRRKVAAGMETDGSPGPQPAAKCMPDLVWDDELATIAQRSANTCKFQHDQCRDVERFRVGQNIAYSGSTEPNYSPDITTLVQMWYDEVKLFSGQCVTNYSFNPAVGHYTQLVWAQSTYLGCGAVKYNEEGFNKVYLVCNYGPAGNVIGQAIYEI